MYFGRLWISKSRMKLCIGIICSRCSECKIGGKLFTAVQSFYKDMFIACVRVEMAVSEWFLVNVYLRQGCVMSQ